MTTLERFVSMLSISLIIAGMIGIHYYMGIGSAVVFGLGVACMTLTINIENIKKTFLRLRLNGLFLFSRIFHIPLWRCMI